MNNVKIEKIGGKIKVYSQYNPDFVRAVKRLGARWDKPAWVFDVRDEERVREICLEIYGTDGVNSDLVDIQIQFIRECSNYHAPIYLLGRMLASASGRDSGAKLGDGVVLLDGYNVTSSGSVKNWKTYIYKDTVLEIRDLPLYLLEKNNLNEGSILEYDDEYDVAKILKIIKHESKTDKTKLELEEEKKELETRIEEINKLLFL